MRCVFTGTTSVHDRTGGSAATEGFRRGCMEEPPRSSAQEARRLFCGERSAGYGIPNLIAQTRKNRI